MPELAETRRNTAGDTVTGEIQVPEIWDFGEAIWDGTRKEVLAKVEMLKTLTVGDIAGNRGIDVVVV